MTNTTPAKMTDIARKAGVSQSTVSLALGNHPWAEHLSRKTKERIRKIADEMGYQHSAIAQAMLSGKTNTIGIMLWDITANNIFHIIDGIMDRASKDSLLLKVFNLSKLVGDQKAIKAALAQRLTGIISIGANSEFAKNLNRACRPFNIPNVYISGDEKIDHRQRVFSDDRKGILEAIQYLEGLGHKEVHFLINAAPNSAHDMRVDAFLKATEKHKIIDAKIVNLPLVEDTYHADNLEIITRHVRRRQRPTAVLCGSDMIGYLVIKAALTVGLKLPEDLSIVGIADYSFSSVTCPSLTTIKQPFAKFGHRAASLLLDMVQGKKIDNINEARRLNVVPTHLTIRESTSSPKPSKSPEFSHLTSSGQI